MFKFVLQERQSRLEEVAASEEARPAEHWSPPLPDAVWGQPAGTTRAPSLPPQELGKVGVRSALSSQMVAVAFYPVTIHQVRMSTDHE